MTDKEKQALKVKTLLEGVNAADEKFRCVSRDAEILSKELSELSLQVDHTIRLREQMDDERKVARELWDEERIKLEKM